MCLSQARCRYDLGMILSIKSQPAPLHIDEDGVARVGRTRVTLETVIGASKNGASAEEITERYDALDLAEIYAVIGYYLSNKPDVDAYLRAPRHCQRLISRLMLIRLLQQATMGSSKFKLRTFRVAGVLQSTA